MLAELATRLDEWALTDDGPDAYDIASMLGRILYGSDTSPSGDGGEPGFINRFLDEAHVVAGIGIMPSEAVRVLKAEIGDGRGTPREDG